MGGMQATVSDHELSEIRGLIETRSGILFDDSRERFFLTRVREHVEARLRRMPREVDHRAERMLRRLSEEQRHGGIHQ